MCIRDRYSAHGAKFQQTDLTMGGERWLNGVSLLADGRAYSNNSEAYVTYELGAKYNRLSLKFVPGLYTNTEFDISNAENGDVLLSLIHIFWPKRFAEGNREEA